MKNYILIILLLYLSNANGQYINGIIDDPRDMTTGETISFTMSDGTKLSTDVYLPVTQDSMVISLEIKGVGKNLFQVIPKGIQYLIYDSINGEINPNPYQLPIILTRTPYNKASSIDYGSFTTILGYAYAMQDMRGAYASEGAYIPMYSDGWDKNTYHPDIHHLLDITESSDPRNANRHEDGYQSIKFITDSLLRIYDYDRDGTQDTFLITKGNVGMYGASALANSQYTAAAAHKVFLDSSGLKSLFPIVGTADLHNIALTQNGVYREALVNNWISNQLSDINDELLNTIDSGLDDTIHSFSDYNLETASQAIDLTLKTMIDSALENELPGYYPNSVFKASMDVSAAPVDIEGESLANGNYSRFTNMDVPAYHLTGWWDIFIDGQINTFNNIRNHISAQSKQLQKLVIGPWAHQTVSQRTTGDITYPDNVTILLGIDLANLENIAETESNIFDTELYKWFRQTLNHNIGYSNPKFIIPESSEWQPLNQSANILIPSEDYIIPYNQFVSFLGGNSQLDSVPFKMAVNGDTGQLYYSIPQMNEPFFNSSELSQNSENNYFNTIPAVRFYVVGPVNDEYNPKTGNYWKATDSFPFTQNIVSQDFFLQSNGGIQTTIPTTQGAISYESDPNNPVLTVGGANMTINTPGSKQRSQGQINLANPNYINLTMDHPGVISFISEEINDSLSIIGIPKATLFASTSIQGLSNVAANTDFFVRIVDVYPDGRELFVVEGAINARAREYAQSIFNGEENPEAPFSNIISDQFYEYNFNLMPIAYTFGKKHRVKVLISSSNYPRYMSSPNIPLNAGEFFRRKPNDGQTYNFEGQEISPRIVENTIAFSATMPSKITLPVFGNYSFTEVIETMNHISPFRIYPNPTNDNLYIRPINNEEYSIRVFDISGKNILNKQAAGLLKLSTSEFKSGVILIEIIGTNAVYTEKILKN
jgi:predicted acyl esterase